MAKILGYKIEKATPHINRKVSIWLDSYDDIFSDFDPSPYSQRHISDDFYHELNKFGIEEMPGIVEIDLMINKKLRNYETEKMIIERINEFFIVKHRHQKKKKQRILHQSFLFMFLGTVLILILALASKKYEDYIILIKLIEPASWFLSWEGLHLLFFEYAEGKDLEEFHHKIGHSKITFIDKN